MSTYTIQGITWKLTGKTPYRRLEAIRGAWTNGRWRWTIVESNNGTGRWDVHSPMGRAVLQGSTANEAARKVARYLNK